MSERFLAADGLNGREAAVSVRSLEAEDARWVRERLGMTMCAFRRDAVTESRRNLKPSIPLMNSAGLPIEHELEFELIVR